MVSLRTLISLSLITTLMLTSIVPLGLSAATPPTPPGFLAGGIFAQYFKNAVENPCPANQYMVGLKMTPAEYMKPDCLGQSYIDSWNVVGNAGTNNTKFLGTTDNQPLRFRTNNTEKMIIDTAGNIGIGTATPGTKLDVNGEIRSNGALLITNGAVATWDFTRIYSDGTTSYYNAGDANNGIAFQFDGLEKMRLLQNGNLGIGTNTPGTKLDVAGNIRQTNGGIYLQNTSAGSQHSIFNYVIPGSSDNGVLYIGAGRDSDNTRNNITLYNLGCSPDTVGGVDYNCNLPIISLLAEHTGIAGNVGIAGNASIAGNLGIGTTTPGAKLDVSGTIHAIGQINTDSTVRVNNNTYGTFLTSYGLYNDGSKPDKNIYIEPPANGGIYIVPNDWSQNLTTTINGDVSIGRNLAVGGSIRLSPATAQIGRVLTATDALGNSEWRAPAVPPAAFALTNDTWLTSTPDGRDRLKFANGGRTYFGSQAGYEWRSAANAMIATLDNAGSLALGGSIRSLGWAGSVSAPRWDTSFYVLQSQYWYGHDSTQALILGESNPVIVRGDIRSPVFYDQDDTDYRVDPNSISILSDLRAKIFYDQDNTSYRVDPNGASVLNTLRIAGGSPGVGKVLTSDATGIASWTAPASSLPAAGAAGGTLYSNGSGWLVSSNIYNNNGNVGIGTATPGAKFEVSSATPEAARFSSTTSSVFLSLYAAGVNKGYIYSTGSNLSLMNMMNGVLSLGSNGAKKLFVTSGGVGIGVDAPSADLDIDGGVRLRTGAGAGKVLTSDADGYARWLPIPVSGGAGGGALPIGYSERDVNLDEDTIGGWVNGALPDTCGNGNAAFTCTPSSSISCRDREYVAPSNWACVGNEPTVCDFQNPGIPEHYRDITCVKATVLVKIGNSCSTSIPECVGDLRCTTNPGAPAANGQAWAQGAGSCGYTCINGYSGANCEIPPCEEQSIRHAGNCGGTVAISPINPIYDELWVVSDPYSNNGDHRILFCKSGESAVSKNLYMNTRSTTYARKTATPVSNPAWSPRWNGYFQKSGAQWYTGVAGACPPFDPGNPGGA